MRRLCFVIGTSANTIYQFREVYVSQGYRGGKIAARLLGLEAIDFLQRLGRLDPTGALIVCVYTDVRKMATIYTSTRVLAKPADLTAFCRGFSLGLPSHQSKIQHVNSEQAPGKIKLTSEHLGDQ